MNTIKSGVKSWKTSLLGIVSAVVVIMQDTSDLSDWRAWLFPVILAVTGILSRDADKSSEQSGVVSVMILALVLSLGCSSCGSDHYIVNTVPYSDDIKSAPGAVKVRSEHVERLGGFDFQPKFRGEILTDYGSVGIDDGQLFADVVIDAQSAK